MEEALPGWEGHAPRSDEEAIGNGPDLAWRAAAWAWWGWVREDADPSGATMTGLMNRSEDDSLDQAKAGLQVKDGYFLKLNRARIEGVLDEDETM
jgi:hypothetical protein